MAPQPEVAGRGSTHRTVRPPSGPAPRPPRTLVTRERLHRALDRGFRQPLTMLVAPAGTGKTVLLADWAARSERPIRWISATGVPAALDELLLPADDSELVIIDDAHLLPAGALEQLSGLLAALLPGAASHLRLVIASRYDLPLPVVDLEVHGMASILRARDLLFRDAEAAALVRAHAAGASQAEVDLLQEKAAGWAAALVLGARAIGGSGDAQTPVLTERPVLDLLLGESFNMLDERTQDVLVCTFGEPDVTSRLATVLSGDKDAGALLADLAASGLLVTAYGDEPDTGTTYRYHPLLVELLRRLVAVGSDDAQRVLAAHRRAAVYFEHHGDANRALGHALAAAEPALIARTLLDHGPAILAAGDLDLVAAAFDALPDDYVDTHAHLLGVRGILRRLTGDLTGAVMDGSRASVLLSAAGSGPEESALEADVLLLRLWQSRFGWDDVDDAIEAAKGLLDRAWGQSDRRAIIGLERLAWLLVELAEAEMLANRVDDALSHLDDVLVTARMAHHSQLVAAGLADRAVLELTRGQAGSAARSAQSALDAAARHGLSDEYVVRAQLVLGLAAFNRLDLDEARHWHDATTAADASSTDILVAALRETLRTITVIEDGELDEARLQLASDPPNSGPMPSFLVRDLALLRLWVAVLVGDRAAVAAQIGVLETSGNAAEAALAKAVDSIGEGDVRSTLDAVDAALALPGVHPGLAASVKAFRTILLLRIEDDAAAERALADLLNDVAPQHLLHPLAMAGLEPRFMDLLQRHTGTPSAHPFASTALDKLSRYQAHRRARGGFVPVIPAADVAPAQPPRPLDAVVNGATIRFTAREAEVLDELALGSSYAEIAQSLFITENTVKTHLLSLYRKLGVDKRSAALRTARSIGLL